MLDRNILLDLNMTLNIIAIELLVLSTELIKIEKMDSTSLKYSLAQ